MDAKKYLIGVLEFYIDRIKSNTCTMSEIESAARTITENMEVYGTISDLAKFYGKSENAVKMQINHKMIDKPKRNVVLYPFQKFHKLVSDKWRSD